jgi:hypothetical protein
MSNKTNDTVAADASTPGATTDEAIGRPGPWREGRYQEKGEPVDNSVTKEPQALPKEPVSKPVSQSDYEQ